MEEKTPPVVIRAVGRDEEGRKKVEKTEVHSRNMDTIKHVEKKLEDKGIQRKDRHPASGISRQPPKAGRGGKYTWEGPDDMMESELSPVPAAIDEKDPNYVDEEEEGRILRGEKSGVAGLVVGEVEVAKVADHRDGVARVEVDAQLNAN
ncbi:hypothetical protein V6N13_021839 [Hibiscus sabdariffa]|uniref:Uncharacterized protein n=1 Tax=Hibiscus sabdariffa TaxID=183260 RepID=A0ABR2CPU8_9ROSI